MSTYIKTVVFDGGTTPGVVILNGYMLRFDNDTEARIVFDLLNQVRNDNANANKQIEQISKDIVCIARTLRNLKEM